MSDFMRPQHVTEVGSAYVTRVINRRQEICQAGTNIPIEQVKATLMEGRRREYQPYLSDIHATTINVDELRTKLTRTCNRVERLMKIEAIESHAAAHFGTALDRRGHHQPPMNITVDHRRLPKQRSFRTSLKISAHVSQLIHTSPIDTYNLVESALMATTTANRVCYYYQQPGHIASTCPLKQQHRQQSAATRQGWQPTRPAY